MKKISALASCIVFALYTMAQDDKEAITVRIVEEGKQLYRSEMASWHGTDVFLEKFEDRSKIGGYFSYTEGPLSKCIFFSQGDTPQVIGTITFDSTYNVSTATADLTERNFTPRENDLFRIRHQAMKFIVYDTLYTSYEDVGFNVIPLIANGEKKVYILAASKEGGVVALGNDYLLTFDEQNQLTGKKKLHQNILLLEYGKEKTGDEKGAPIGAMHTHLPETGDFITSTDICTLMLYSKLAGWQQHMVVTPRYMNIWNCQTNKLIAIPRNTFEKISKDQEQRKKGNK